MEIRTAQVLDFVLSEGTVYGARYYIVEPNFGGHTQTWFGFEWDQMVEWCVETYGPTLKKGVFEPGGLWYTNNAKFLFRNEIDRNFFILKWR